MATEKIKFQLNDDTEVVVDPKLLKGYLKEASTALGAEATAKASFKEVIETVSETTKLPKALVSKYFKAKYKEATAKDKEIGEVFTTLDEAVGE